MALGFAFLLPQADNVCNCLRLITFLTSTTKPSFFPLLLFLFSPYPETVPAGCPTWTSGYSLVSVFPSHPNSVCQIASDPNMTPIFHAYHLQSHHLTCSDSFFFFLNFLCRSGFLAASLFQFCTSSQSIWLSFVYLTFSHRFLSLKDLVACYEQSPP